MSTDLLKLQIEELKLTQKQKEKNRQLVNNWLKHGTPAESKFWEVSDTLLGFFIYHHNPLVRLDMQKMLIEARQARETAKNKYSSTADKTLRRSGIMPAQYLNALEAIYGGKLPMPFSKFQKAFFRRYPAFRTAPVL